jgi:tetratricopeptide (TPR) repeat protein
MPLAVGSHVGRIRIDALLGAGGMGEVYRGWDDKLERAVALKSITSERRLSPALRARFLREARVLSRLDHPNICRIWDVLELADGDWLVLELIDGPTMRERMDKGLSRQESVEIALEIARVLAVAHGRGIIHRDLKPENVMQTSSGVVKVLDFGLARAVEAEYGEPSEAEAEVLDLEKTLIIGGERGGETTAPDDSRTSVGSLVGTLHYMSPEQARGLPLTPASDVYSLGVILYEMLRGRDAYGDVESVADLLQRVRGAKLEPFNLRDRELQRLLARMTALQPADRAAAGDVVSALERIVSRPHRRRRHIIELASIAAMLAIVVMGVFVMRQVVQSGSIFATHRGSRIAILPFRNATGDRGMQWIELGLMDHVARGLTGVRGADIIESDAVVKSMKQLRLASGGDLAAGTRNRLLDTLGADALIASTVTLRDGRYTIRYTAFDRERSEEPRDVTSAQITDAANQMSARIADRIDPTPHRHLATNDTFAAIAFDMGRQIEMSRGGKYALAYYAVAADRDPQFLVAKEQLADNWAKQGRLAEAMPLMEEVQREARRRNERGLLVDSLINMAYWHYSRGDSGSQERYAREALSVATQLGEARRIGDAQNALGVALLSENRTEEAERTVLAALEIARRLHARQDIAERVNNLGLLAMRRNDRPAAKRYLEEAMQIAEQIGYRDLIALVVGNLAIIYGDAGDFAKAEELTKKNLAMARELGDKKTMIEALTNLGLWSYATGREQEAIGYTEEARTAAAEFGARQLEALLLSNLAQARTRLGDLAGAQRDAEAALALGKLINDPEFQPDILIGAAYPAIRAGRLAEAARLIDKANAIRMTARGAIFRARLLYEQHKYAEAYALMQKAKAMGDVWFPQYETMLRAFEESARTGKASTIRFEEDLSRHADVGHLRVRDLPQLLGRELDLAGTVAAAEDRVIERHDPLVDVDRPVGG